MRAAQMNQKIPITISVCNITKGFDPQSILTTEIGLSAFAADCYIAGIPYESLDQQIFEYLSLSSLGLDKFDAIVQRIDILTENKFLFYIQSAVHDQTVKDFDSFLKFYKKESPTAVKISKPKT